MTPGEKVLAAIFDHVPAPTDMAVPEDLRAKAEEAFDLLPTSTKYCARRYEIGLDSSGNIELFAWCQHGHWKEERVVLCRPAPYESAQEWATKLEKEMKWAFK